MRNPRNSFIGIFLLLLALLRLSLPCARAQESPSSNVVRNQDGSVTFRYEDPVAKSMKIVCDCKLRRETVTVRKENYHSVKMERDSSGLWTYTTQPLAPEVYTYQFERDGVRFPDPANPDSIRVHQEMMGVFIIGGTPQVDLYISSPLRGRLDTVVFPGGGGKPRRVTVYTPPQYAEGQDSYPVLYLLHGLNGNETAWLDRGRAAQSLDNLIAMHKAKPMILVMPDANPEALINTKNNNSLAKNIFLYPAWSRREFENIFPELDDFLSGLYRFTPRLGGRAAAGLSAGGKQSCNLAIMYDSTFTSVGLFSPVVGHRQVPNTNYTKYWIGGGTGDLFHHRINKFRKRLQRNHIYYTMYNTRGGHTWRNWRAYFTDYVQTLFWN